MDYCCEPDVSQKAGAKIRRSSIQTKKTPVYSYNHLLMLSTFSAFEELIRKGTLPINKKSPHLYGKGF